MTPPRGRAATVFVVLLTALVGCGGDGGGGDTATGGGCDEVVETVTVEIPEFRYEPEAVAVERCSEVVWSNTHDQAHTATASGDSGWNTGNIAPGESSEPVQMADGGTFAYICGLHPFMQASVEVSG
jgi:plastocyanin